jgi:hypothetical protein
VKNRITINNSYRQLLLIVSAISLLGFAGCSSLDAGAGKTFHTSFITKMDPQSNGDDDVVAANRDWYQMGE